MAKITQLNDGESGLSARTKINEAIKTVETDDSLQGTGEVGNPLTVVSAGEKVKVSSTDTTESYLNDKITVTANLLKSILNPAGNEEIELDIAAAITKLITFENGILIEPIGTTGSGIQFDDLQNNAFYQSVADKLNIRVGGSGVISFEATIINALKQISAEAGIVVDPNQTFTTDNGLRFGLGNSELRERADGILSTYINSIESTRFLEDGLRVNPLSSTGAVLSFGLGGAVSLEAPVASQLQIKVNSSLSFIITSSEMLAGTGASWSLKNAAPSATVPSLVPNRTDGNTGIGSSGADLLSLIAGGVEGARISPTVQKFNGQAIGGDEIKTFSATPEFDFDDGNTQEITLTADITSWTIANELAAGQYEVYFIQDGTGGHSIADPTGIDKQTNESLSAFDTTADAINIVNIFVTPSGVSIWSIVGTA